MEQTREYLKYIVPHSDYGDPECPGLIMVEAHCNEAQLVCNDCGAVIRRLPTADAEQVVAGMSSGELTSAVCPHCGGTNFFAGFSAMLAYVCRHCWQGVAVEGSVH